MFDLLKGLFQLRLFFFIVVWGCFFTPVFGVVAEETLISNPPFKQVSKRQAKEQTFATQGSINQRYELSGIISIAGELKFSVHDKTTQKPLFLSVGESVNGVSVESFNHRENGIVMSQGGKRELLVLREGKDQSKTGRSRKIPSYNSIPNATSKNYPKPPPALPKPSKLIEQLRNQKSKNQGR